MGKRVGLLVALVVTVMGTTTAAQSPSPTPLYAPEDLALLLPRQIQGVALTVGGQTGLSSMAGDSTLDLCQDLLIGLEREPSDLRIAFANTTDPSVPERYRVMAMRVDGVAADILMDRFLQLVASAEGQTLPPYSESPTLTIGGRTIVLRYGNLDDPSTWMFIYTRGEVAFMVIASGGVTMEEVLAEWPWGA